MRQKRIKISTTIAPEGYALLERMITSGRAENLAAAIDLALDEIGREENRARLERAASEYFENRTAEELAEDAAFESALGKTAAHVNFDE